ncbi:DgyrCDS5425 [Dimorphilus gyrociliatus]|uniref:DgyrCDS5425 n=1 Tax=Dimorphilus gyrociliatus TaxID=2664684 RepID=A0A7I8VJU2_9ANNE|nr:DgyrCDS5425 [Dimorphilus gyrociliatus]
MSKFKDDSNQNINVFVRCRPLSESEKKNGQYSIVQSNPEKREIVVKEKSGYMSTTKTFSFDRVFSPKAKQIEVYKAVVQPLLDEILLGYNCTVFAYGQTGTGKTFTMEGDRSNDPSLSWENDPLAGIIPRSMSQLFSRLHSQSFEFTVRVSYLEIYNEELIDLLGGQTAVPPRLKIYESSDKKGSCKIQGLEEAHVRDKHDVYRILELGSAKRQTAATNLNAHSSRSHTLFMVTVHMKESTIEGQELVKVGKLNLVDLAGSECVGRSGAVANRAREAGNINQSLLTLGRVITSLVEHAPHVPYRESKLTRLLRDSLGGRTKTSIIATLTPASGNLEETLNTLDYAHRAKNVMNKPEINQKVQQKVCLRAYGDEIERLRKDLQAARDKNGVFIEEENYQAMIADGHHKSEHIRELEEKLQFIIDEKIKFEELFLEKEERLEEEKEHHAETKDRLDKMEDVAFQAKVSIARTRADRCAKNHLVEKQVDTETKLTEEAKKVMNTADESVSDVQKLQDKVDRTKKTESTNADNADMFMQKISTTCTEMQERFNGLYNNHDSEIKQCFELTASLSESNKRNFEDLSANLKDFISRSAENHSSHMGKLEEIKKTCTDSSNKQMIEIETALKEEMEKATTQWNQVMENFEDLSERLDVQINKFSKLSEKLLKQNDEIKTTQKDQKWQFDDLLMDTKFKLEETVKNFVSTVDKHGKTAKDIHEQRKQVDEEVSQLNNQVEEDYNNIKKMLNDLQAKVDAKHNQFKKASDNIDSKTKILNDYTAEACERFEETKNSFTTMGEENVENVVDLKSLRGEHSEKIDRIRNNHFEENAEYLERITAGISNIGINITKERKNLRRITDNRNKFQEEQLEKEKSLQAMFLDNIDKTITNGLEDETTRNDEANKHIDDIKLNVSKHYTTTKDKLKNFDESLQDCKKHCDGMSKETNDFCNDQSNIADRFVSELQRTVPTGETPVRKQYTYPRVFSQTDSHGTIIEEFRSVYDKMTLPKELPKADKSDILEPVLKDDIEEPEIISKFELEDPEETEVSSTKSEESEASRTSSLASMESTKENLAPDDNEVFVKPTSIKRTASIKSKSRVKTPSLERKKAPLRSNSKKT